MSIEANLDAYESAYVV
jgi:hypothetical protein